MEFTGESGKDGDDDDGVETDGVLWDVTDDAWRSLGKDLCAQSAADMFDVDTDDDVLLPLLLIVELAFELVTETDFPFPCWLLEEEEDDEDNVVLLPVLDGRDLLLPELEKDLREDAAV